MEDETPQEILEMLEGGIRFKVVWDDGEVMQFPVSFISGYGEPERDFLVDYFRYRAEHYRLRSKFFH